MFINDNEFKDLIIIWNIDECKYSCVLNMLEFTKILAIHVINKL